MGFSSIELEGIGSRNVEYLYKNKEKIAGALQEYGCSLPVLCIVLPQLSSSDPGKHSEALELFEAGCATAHYLGATGVLDNGPLLPLVYSGNAPIRRHYGESDLLNAGLPEAFIWGDYWHQLTSVYTQACDIAAKYGLQYQMHPCEGSLITGTDSFINFSQAVNCDNLKFNLDTANQYYFRDNLPLSVLRLADKINYIHISDNGGSRVEHLVPGTGLINWNSFFNALRQIGYKGHFALDVGGAETGIADIESAYNISALWLQDQMNRYSL